MRERCRRSRCRAKLVAENLGSPLLAALVIGSGIVAQRLSPHDAGAGVKEVPVARRGSTC